MYNELENQIAEGIRFSLLKIPEISGRLDELAENVKDELSTADRAGRVQIRENLVLELKGVLDAVNSDYHKVPDDIKLRVRESLAFDIVERAESSDITE